MTFQESSFKQIITYNLLIRLFCFFLIVIFLFELSLACPLIGNVVEEFSLLLKEMHLHSLSNCIITCLHDLFFVLSCRLQLIKEVILFLLGILLDNLISHF